MLQGEETDADRSGSQVRAEAIDSLMLRIHCQLPGKEKGNRKSGGDQEANCPPISQRTPLHHRSLGVHSRTGDRAGDRGSRRESLSVGVSDAMCPSPEANPG